MKDKLGHITLSELLTLAKETKTLLNYSKEIFKENFRILSLGREMRYSKKWELKFLFKHFLEFIEELTIDGFIFHHNNHTIRLDSMKVFIHYCNNSPEINLRRISFKRFHQSTFQLTKIYPYVQNVTSICLYSCLIPSSVITILNNLNNTREIEISNCYSKSFTHERTPKTELEINNELKKFTLRYNDDLELFEVLTFMNTIMPNIHKLKLNQESESIPEALRSISKLKQLRKATINFNNEPTDPFLKNIQTNDIKLEKLKITKGGFSLNATSELALVTSLKRLTLDNVTGLSTSNLIHIIKNLHKLRTLHLKNIVDNINTTLLDTIFRNNYKIQHLKLSILMISLDDEAYLGMLRTIKRTRNKKGTTIHCNVPFLQNRMSENILTHNKGWLNIIDTYED